MAVALIGPLDRHSATVQNLAEMTLGFIVTSGDVLVLGFGLSDQGVVSFSLSLSLSLCARAHLPASVCVSASNNTYVYMYSIIQMLTFTVKCLQP